MVYGFSLFPRLFCLVFVGKLVLWALFSGHPFLGAKNSESCLNQFLSNYAVSVAGSIRNPFLGFKLQTRSAKTPNLNIKTMIHFGFLSFVFCL
ncbi:hypothetical protein CRN50_09540 [Vibrio vulnificus]|nr:hypothetical protein CRN50_09540 [Vibrio vulnificus]